MNYYTLYPIAKGVWDYLRQNVVTTNEPFVNTPAAPRPLEFLRSPLHLPDLISSPKGSNNSKYRYPYRIASLC